MKEIVIISSHADSEEKILTLSNCISQINKQGFDIILSSHIPIPENIVNTVNYFVYDSTNLPIIFGEDEFDKSYSFYFTNGDYYQSSQAIKYHSYSILRLYTNALAIAWANGYSISHFVNYDYIINEESLLKKHSYMLESCDIFGYHDLSYDANMRSLDCGIFSARIDPFLNCSKNIKSKKDFLVENEPVLESFIHKYFSDKNGLKIKSDDRSLLLNSDNVIDFHKFDTNIINGEIIIYLTKEQGLENYFVSVFTNKSKDYILEIQIDDEKRIHSIRPNYSVNVIDVTDFIISGKKINVKIGEVNFSNSYSIDTDATLCTFVSKYYVIKYHNLQIAE